MQLTIGMCGSLCTGSKSGRQPYSWFLGNVSSLQLGGIPRSLLRKGELTQVEKDGRKGKTLLRTWARMEAAYSVLRILRRLGEKLFQDRLSQGVQVLWASLAVNRIVL